jgi:hypothetical protein
MPRPVLGRGGRRVRQTGGEILLAHVYHNEEERWCRFLSGSVLFRWVHFLRIMFVGTLKGVVS